MKYCPRCNMTEAVAGKPCGWCDYRPTLAEAVTFVPVKPPAHASHTTHQKLNEAVGAALKACPVCLGWENRAGAQSCTCTKPDDRTVAHGWVRSGVSRSLTCELCTTPAPWYTIDNRDGQRATWRYRCDTHVPRQDVPRVELSPAGRLQLAQTLLARGDISAKDAAAILDAPSSLREPKEYVVDGRTWRPIHEYHPCHDPSSDGYDCYVCEHPDHDRSQPRPTIAATWAVSEAEREHEHHRLDYLCDHHMREHAGRER